VVFNVACLSSKQRERVQTPPVVPILTYTEKGGSRSIKNFAHHLG